MAEGHVTTQERISGRYWPQEVVHQEEGRTGWHGQDVEFQRPVSLVETRPADPVPGESLRRTAARILRESEAMALAFPGRVATVFDVVEENGALWTVMERIEGTPLSDVLRHGPVSYVRAARMGLELLDLLAAAHNAGIAHGDLSPGQVFVRQNGRIIVTGWGLLGGAAAQRITAPSYASPEQARGEATGPASDLWTLGAILYTMIEGRPPIRDRGPVDATLRAVDRLPIRTPVNAGPLSPAVQGLLRRDPLERLPEPVVRLALNRILREDPEEQKQLAPLPCLRDAYAAAWRTGRVWGRRSIGRPVLLGVAALIVAGASLTALALTGESSDDTPSVAVPTPSRAAPSSPPGQNSPTARPTSPPPRSPTPTPSATRGAQDPPASGFARYRAPEGFSIDLPKGWKRLQLTGPTDNSYRVTFGASGDPRTLAITYSERLGPDPVEVWQDLEPALREATDGFERIGDVHSVDYRGLDAADMEWFSDVDGVRERTQGRGFIIEPGRGYSFRWTTPAKDWNDSANEQALDVFFRSFEDETTG
ncbi:serine/threonine protein kinase [Streptomyces sp. NPDC058274]|uniref:serine/threonine protein kinase n=1 Tax=Streptomyces sp. NPDC058274 TaxID=3346416 RepID=UPI0036E5B593